MKTVLTDWLVGLGAVALVIVFVAGSMTSVSWFTRTVRAQPVPRQEQNSRLIQALEHHNRTIEENTRAMRELTQALRSQNRPF